MSSAAATMMLRILTPHGPSAEIPCDSAVLTLRDDVEGQGGGLVGIQKDHAPAVMALGEGEIRASLGGNVVFRAVLQSGFASVRDNVITVITDSAEIE